MAAEMGELAVFFSIVGDLNGGIVNDTSSIYLYTER